MPNPENNPYAHHKSAEMHVCNDCGGRQCQPLNAVPYGKDDWWVSLECPNCEEQTTGVYSQADFDAYDEEMDAQYAALIKEYSETRVSNREDEITAFVIALETGLIRPEDF